MKKTKTPAEIREHLAAIGRRGGAAQVPKGFALMDPQKHRKASAKGGKAGRRRKATQ